GCLIQVWRSGTRRQRRTGSQRVPGYAGHLIREERMHERMQSSPKGRVFASGGLVVVLLTLGAPKVFGQTGPTAEAAPAAAPPESPPPAPGANEAPPPPPPPKPEPPPPPAAAAP